jgi:hypothetical protein
MTDPLEGPFETPSYIGMHPAEVFYHFWDGTIRWTSFTPEGAKVNDQWIWPDHKRLLDEALKLAGKERIRRLRTLVLFELGNDVNSWACVDFSYGSDPLFSRHKDPRRVLFETLSAYEK